jgi:hypothetical protein
MEIARERDAWKIPVFKGPKYENATRILLSTTLRKSGVSNCAFLACISAKPAKYLKCVVAYNTE